MTALALLAPVFGLALVLMLQAIESRVLDAPTAPQQRTAPAPIR
jgi:hypothetical protein